MKAMILAAGYGTRLGEVGKVTPKCLIEVGGKTMLEHIVSKLKGVGVRRLAINVHHLASQVMDFVAGREFFGIEIQFFQEKEILGTGGGVKNAQSFLCSDNEDFFVHNGDVYSDVELSRMLDFHRKNKASATLAVRKRETRNCLVCDNSGRLCGWINEASKPQEVKSAESSGNCVTFAGIHVVSPKIFEFMQQDSGFFSILSPYMQAASAGEKLMVFDMQGSFWIDVGTTQRVEELRKRLEKTGKA